MQRKLIYLLSSVLVFCFCLSSVTQAADIVWVTDAYDDRVDGIPDDYEWVDLLESLGYNVDVTQGAALGDGYWRTLDDNKIAQLNAADLVIISRCTDSTAYDDDNEIAQWNSITAPMIQFSPYLVRSSRWMWMNSTELMFDGGAPALEAIDTEHPIFTGITLDENNQVQILNPEVGTGDTSFIGSTDVGNGTLIAKTAGEDWTFIAEWETGVEFYPGAGQFATNRRMTFMAGVRENVDENKGRAEYNLYDVGAHIFINAVDYMLGVPLRTKAFLPRPREGRIDVSREPVLGWRPGALAVTHNVFLGTDVNNVNEAGIDDPRGTLVGQDLSDITFTPAGLLDYEKTYYWRVDEINDAEPDSPWKGDLWSFTVLNYIVLEDFEDYNDYPPDEIWNTWIDGFGDSSNGSTAGYPNPDFVIDEHYVETSIVNGGRQSMPVFYDNAAGISEVTRSLTESDWTRDDVVTLTMFYYGDPNNAAEPMYVTLNDSATVTNDDPGAALVTEWTRWDIPLQLFAEQGVNLTNVNSISIGFGNKANPTIGGAGRVFFDDIRLYRQQ